MSKWNELYEKIHNRLTSKQEEGYLWGSVFDNAWMGYILSKHRRGNEGLIESLKIYLDSWYEREEQTVERDVAALGLYIRFKSNLGYPLDGNKLEEIKRRVIVLLKKDDRFSLSNSPELFFALSLGEILLDPTIRQRCAQILIRELRNNWYNSNFRFAFYTASAFETNFSNEEYLKKVVQHISSIDIGKIIENDLFALVWFITAYMDNIKEYFEMEDKNTIVLGNIYESLLSEFENIIPTKLTIDDDDILPFSIFQLGLYYDIVASVLEKSPEPLQLFEGFPLHPKVREVTYQLFKEGHYYEAVRNATTLYISEVKNKAGRPRDRQGKRELDGRSLMQETFKLDAPVLRLNTLSTQSERDEQEGFMHLSMGTVLGIRNPKAHELSEEDPYRALEYLVLISMLMKRLDECKRVDRS